MYLHKLNKSRIIYISNSGECLRTTPKGIGCVRFPFYFAQMK